MAYILWTLLCIYALWPLYVFVMAMLRARVDGTTTATAWILTFPLVISAITLDIALNYTVFALLTWDFPKKGEYTFSQRLKRLANGGGWKQAAARWLAKTLLDPYDPTSDHLGLKK